MTERQQDALTSLLIDAGIAIGKYALREVDKRLRQQERDADRREQVQPDVIRLETRRSSLNIFSGVLSYEIRRIHLLSENILFI